MSTLAFALCLASLHAQDATSVLPEVNVLAPVSEAASAEALTAARSRDVVLREATRLGFEPLSMNGPIHLVHKDMLSNGSYAMMHDVVSLMKGHSPVQPLLLSDFPEPVRLRLAKAFQQSSTIGRFARAQAENLRFVAVPTAYLGPSTPESRLPRPIALETVNDLPATHPGRDDRIESYSSSTVPVGDYRVTVEAVSTDTRRTIILCSGSPNAIEWARRAASVWKALEERLVRLRSETRKLVQEMLEQELGSDSGFDSFAKGPVRWSELQPTLVKHLRRQSAWRDYAAVQPPLVLRTVSLQVYVEVAPRQWQGLPLELLLSEG